ncbi:bifunctional cytidylyltransferase/SDR family oxidoreductase [Nocardioides sp. GY 10113]|uniref:bifunctional cytidylyltransferase/SDR family oxidoreductase n=1 Tax=Nocardioides sp. GY 10113 TaxID=2569761 RepID=UPI0010A83F65|nr:bifunctional cytidylyltransferase/SDR family oxidoreductase [Nocardioides sp. GY 10113]TIC89219.1 bifunctional cytidylyltransferase/SDR family oxidoreductase [Nocardioides sp. GY 10113]
MSAEVKNVAVLLAGGVGSRVGLDIPKQLIKVAGKTLLEHTLVTLHDHPDVHEVVVMMAPGHLDAVRQITRSGAYPKVTGILEGGETRNDTTLRAIEHLHATAGGAEVRILLHDAVRPLVTPRIIGECFAALEEYPAVDVAIPSADTIIEVDGADTISNIPPRASLRRGQTPQAFRLEVLARAYELAGQDPDFAATDDCSVVLRYLPDEPIIVVRGDDRNMKVTEPIDVFIADKLFQLTGIDLPRTRTEEGYREALAGKTVVVFGGSYGIGADIAEVAASYGAHVITFSRSTTNTDVGRRADVAAAAKKALEVTGSVDFVVNTAGVLPRGELSETSEETIYSATEINYLGPIFIAQEFFPHLAATGGSLLLFTSSSYTRGRSGYALYSSAKAATVNLTQALADEWADAGVRVNCINPERTATPMRTRAFGQEAPGTLLDSPTVARTSIDVLVSEQSGHVYDVRRDDPFGL